MRSRGYCRSCDRAVEVEGDWPGVCRDCGHKTEPHPVPDVVAKDLRLLLVGINPGIRTARARRHFAFPQNPFWRFLHESGLTPRRISPEGHRELLDLRMGITNAVSRATPGTSDLVREDIERGRKKLAELVKTYRPNRLAFIGRQTHGFAAGLRRSQLGPVGPVFGASAFVVPSTSPANASIPASDKLEWFALLRRWLDEGPIPKE